MRKYLFILLLSIGIFSCRLVNAQPPPPPPDPGGVTTDPYPPGWVGKSPVGDGDLILISLALAYSLSLVLKKKKDSVEKNIS
jgi:hypothetical protein